MEAKGIKLREPRVQHSALASALGGKVTRTVYEDVFRVKVYIGKLSFTSDKKYGTLKGAQKAATRLIQSDTGEA